MHLSVLRFAQFLTPYLVELARNNVLKNIFTKILSGLLSQYRLILAYKLTGGHVVTNETFLQFVTKLGLMAHFNQAGGGALLSYEGMDDFFAILSRA